MTYYDVLGILPSATDSEIKTAYRKLAIKLHPDVNKADDAHEKFIALGEAYLILSDPAARQLYDLKIGLMTASFVQEDKSEPAYDIEDLITKARVQSTEISEWSFDVFVKKLGQIASETGFQLGNAILMGIGMLMFTSGCGRLFIGPVLGFGEDDNLLVNVIIAIGLMVVGLVLSGLSQYNFDKHSEK